MNSKVDAIVLKTAPHKENDILLSLLTMSSGRIDALVRGAKKAEDPSFILSRSPIPNSAFTEPADRDYILWTEQNRKKTFTN